MKGILLLAGTSLATALPAAAYAEAAKDTAAAAVSENEVADIIVTARRTSETAQSVPMSIIALSQTALRQQNISSAQELGKAVPGLTVESITGNPNIAAFAIRGRGLNFGAAAGAVETYFADAPLSMPYQAFALPPQFFDLGSFQILKGPQGTLFGRSTTGGAVLIVPHAVDDELGGYARLQGGSYGDFQAEGAINIPLKQDFAGLRLAGFFWRRDGYSYILPGNTEKLTGLPLDGQRFNNKSQYELRGTLKLTPVENLENTTIITYHNDGNYGSAGAGLIKVGAGAVQAPGFGTEGSNSVIRYSRQARNKVVAVINTTTATVSDELTFKNIFSYTYSHGLNAQPINADGTNLAKIALPFSPRTNRTRMYTDEVQLQGTQFDGRFKWIAGVIFDATRQPMGLNDLDIQSVTFTGAACGATPNCNSIRTTYGSNRVSSHGLFASGTLNLLSNLTLSGGFRRSYDSVLLKTGPVFDPVLVSPNATPPLTPPTAAALTTFQSKFAGNTYNADLSYKFGNGIVYAGYRHGYKRGGFQPSSNLSIGASFDPETIDNLYAGVKSQFMVAGRQVRANLEVYHDSYHGQQVSYNTLSAGSVVSGELNIDRTRYQGFDLDVNAELANWWNLSLNYGFIDAKIKQWIDRSVAGSTVDLTGNPIPYVARNKLSMTSRFHKKTSIGEAVFQAVLNYEDKFVAGPTCHTFPLSVQQIFRGNYDVIAAGGCQVPAHTTGDLRFELNNVADTNLSLAATVTNVTNKIYTVGTSNTLLFGAEGFSYAPPRLFTFDVSYKF